MNPTTLWDDLCKLVIRPQRCSYDPSVSLGPKIFQLGSNVYERTDFELINPRGFKLKCSHYQPTDRQRKAIRLPCVIYCHGNCGSRCDALDAVQMLLPYNITVLAFDFSGSGLSEGDYVSLGFYEKQDVSTLVEYLWSEKGRVSRIGLWGRSMGAATSLMYASVDHSIAGIVLDSPFSALETVMVDLVKGYQKWIPEMAIKLGTKAMRTSIKNKAGFDIWKLSPIEAAKHCFVPALFAHAEGDNFIKISHSEQIHATYGGDKNFIRFEGDHNSERPDFFFDSVCIFFYNLLVANDPILGAQTIPKGSVAKRLGVGFRTDQNAKISLVNSNLSNSSDDDSDDDEVVAATTAFLHFNEQDPAVNAAMAGSLPVSPHQPQWNLYQFQSDQQGSEEDDQMLVQGLLMSINDALGSCQDTDERKKLLLDKRRLEIRLAALERTTQ